MNRPPSELFIGFWTFTSLTKCSKVYTEQTAYDVQFNSMNTAIGKRKTENWMHA
uniref:hypothetical protein n=1 Tax=Salmonella sp. TaxID=599 RepID=UPI001CD957C0|nr:hypothetical protein [Salmonella sp.]